MTTTTEAITGELTLISGPMISASGMLGVGMGEILRVGNMNLMGEVIRIDGDTVFAQVFEDTSGMYLGEPVVSTGLPLSVELGPGLLGSTFDGIQRPLITLQQASGDFIDRGLTAVALDREKRWSFTPTAKVGDKVVGGDVLGTVPETEHLTHKVMVPPNSSGTIQSINDGEFTVEETIATLDDGTQLKLMHPWPVKLPRPYHEKQGSDELFLTGQRVLDCLFPIALGGSAIVPGGFGAGKTVVEQSLSKYCNADIIIYVGCGERGNEMADVLDEFPDLTDPKTGGPLMDRTVLVVNTSNMPVAARDASVYTGITLAEYYRDQGYNVALMADSTSRWAEALREISSRLEEMPGEEGYPTYLAARISQFYERAGRVICAGSQPENGEGGRTGSVTAVGAVSPPGGDFSEPVTQTSMRVAGGLWALDSALAYRRHYPSVNWNRSYTLYLKELSPWFDKHAPAGWLDLRQRISTTLQKDAELQEVVQLVGPDALQDAERLTLEVSRMIREVFLQQNAFSENDAFCSLEKNAGIQEALMAFYDESKKLVDQEISLQRILDLPVREDVSRLRDEPNDGFAAKKDATIAEMKRALAELAKS